MNKQELRGRMRAMRRMLSQSEREAAAQALAERLAAFGPYRHARSVMAYVAARGELSLAPVLEDILASGKTLLLPRCESPGVMTAREIRSMDDLAPGAYGLMEPRAECPVGAPERIDLILIPGTAFDAQGNRLGQGGGYYDRFLEKTDAVRAGVCHSFALLDAVPRETHDKKMDYLITPGGILRAGSDIGHDRRT